MFHDTLLCACSKIACASVHVCALVKPHIYLQPHMYCILIKVHMYIQYNFIILCHEYKLICECVNVHVYKQVIRVQKLVELPPPALDLLGCLS